MGKLGKKNSTRDRRTEEVGKFPSSTVEGDLGGERGCLMFSILPAFCNLLSLVVWSFLVYQTLVHNTA